MVRAGEFRRRAFLRCSAAWFAGFALRGPIAWAGDGPGTEPPIELPFETTPGARFRIVESTFSRFESDPSDTPLVRERGGMFRSEYEAQVTERDPAGVATVWFRSERGNGLYWTSRDQLIAYDSREPVEPYRPTGHSSLGGYLVEHGRRSEFVVKLSPRSELVASYESLGGGRAGWVSAAEAHRAPQMHGLLLPLAKAPVRTADMTATQMRADSDTLGWPYDNRVVVPVDVRFEGATSTYARFSISGRATGSKEPGPGDEVRWVDVVEMEGVVDVDRTTGWVLSRDQTTIVTYRSILRAQVRDRGPGVAHVVNRRRLRVNGSRLP